ncbi:N-acetylmuramoyl-L-alanine amidase [Rhodothermaceae bacterium RA]|nr:N-acetylmuramoyl-L-alanine amidase [Rhodothermaceae bacterium RA]
MALGLPSKRGKRDEILRAVYEENRRISAATGPGKPDGRQQVLRGVYETNRAMRRPRRAPRPWRLRLWQASAAVLVLVLGAAVVGLTYRGGPGLVAGSLAGSPAGDRGGTADGPRERLTPATPDSALLAAALAAQNTRRELTLANVYGLEIRTIVIDAGHGGRDPGAVGPSGLFEKDITLDVALRLKALLEQRDGYRILLTRTGDESVSLRDRVEFANRHGADLFVSIHVNALHQDDLSVVETYYFGAEATDEATLAIAERENRGAGYSLADFTDMVQRLGSRMKLEESKRLAESIQTSLYRNMRTVNADLRSWGVRKAPFVVLLGVETPSVLAEVACISNPTDEQRLSDPAHRTRLAAALEEGIVRYLDQRAPARAVPSPLQPEADLP